MSEELSKIDVSCIDALRSLKDQQDVLDGRIKAMDDMKASVAEPVYLRVRSDYVAQRDGLESQARPLRDQAREQYGRLLAVMSGLESEQETIRMDKQELELRHQLGEFDKKEFDKRVKAIDASAAEKSDWYGKAQDVRTRFLAAVRSEDELRIAQPAPKPKPTPAAAAPAAVRAPAADAFITGELPAPAPNPASTNQVPANPHATPPPPSASVASEGTMVMPAIKLPPAAPQSAATSEATMMFRPSRLVPQNPEAGKATYTLALKILTIGSDSTSDIRVGGPGVEPKHAQIAPTPKGYTIQDFDTKHGTRVNAEKIKERVLANEDVVQVGAARFVFRST